MGFWCSRTDWSTADARFVWITWIGPLKAAIEQPAFAVPRGSYHRFLARGHVN